MVDGQLLPFQPFSLCRVGTSSLVLGGYCCTDQKGALSFVEVSGRLLVSDSLELPAAVMNLDSSSENSMAVMSLLHSPCNYLCKTTGTKLELMGCEAMVPTHYVQTFSVFDPGGRTMITASSNNTIALWRVFVKPSSPMTEILSVVQHLCTINIPSINSLPTISGVCWSPDGKAVVVTGNTVYLYSTEFGPVGVPKGLEGFYEVPIKGDGNSFDYKGCIFSDTTTLFVFRRYREQKQSTIVKYRMTIGKYISQVREEVVVDGAYHTAYAIDRAKERLAFGTSTGEIVVMDCKTLEVTFRTQAHMYSITGLSFVMNSAWDEEVIVSCGLDKRIVQTRTRKDEEGTEESVNYGFILFISLLMVLVLLECATCK
eukprot:TRINITY_DN15998_c0_g1_i1.p1 TRINITY_DN15998_c0_g1~~TRINITY_DN15998_c0_g1_i1.p1  ORF type:complete len:371 (+),score=27.39 TRINITY_DN15998_c0_g1_i1:45-1157(+)